MSDVNLELRVTVDKFNSDVQKSYDKLNKAAKDSGKVTSDEMLKAAKGASAAATAITGAAVAVYSFVDSVMDARAEIVNLSTATGIGTETLSALEVAARRSGVTIDEVMGGFEDFGEVMADAAAGGGRAVDAFELLGVQVNDANGELRATDDVLREAIEGMVGLENQAQRNAVAQQLFGDSGNRLNAILGDGTLEEYTRLAEAYGTLVDDEAVVATRNWERATADLQGVFEGAKSSIVDSLDLTEAIDNLSANLVFLGTFTQGALEELGAIFARAGAVISKVLGGDFDGAYQQWIENNERTKQSVEELVAEAVNAAREFNAAREAVEDSGEAAGTAGGGYRKLRSEIDALNSSAEEAAKAQRQLEQGWLDAFDTLDEVVQGATADTVGAYEAVLLQQDEWLAKIQEVEGVLGESVLTQEARADVYARTEREIQELNAQTAQNYRDTLDELEQLEQQYHEQRLGRLVEYMNEAVSVYGELTSAALTFTDIAMQGIVDYGSQVSATLDEQLAEREALEEAIQAATSESERVALESELNQLNASIEGNQAIIADEQAKVDRLFAAGQALEIANATIYGASAAIAALAPPPIGAGPVIGIALAAGVAATTAAQIATILAESPPQFDAGSLGAQFTKGPDNYVTLREGEAQVTNQRATEVLGGAAALREVNETGRVSGNSRELVLNIGGRELGRVVVDEMNAGRELTAQINQVTGRMPGSRPVYGR